MAQLVITVDCNADAAYLQVSDGTVVRTEEVAPGVLVDLDEYRMAVGVEVLELDVLLPVDLLIREYHVPRDAVEALGRVRPTVTSFVSRQAEVTTAVVANPAWEAVTC